jgi:hypothetical protein
LTDIDQFKLMWFDGHRSPKCPADPKYPDGVVVDLSNGGEATCKIELPYPAPRVGHYEIECRLCNIRVGCTTAGRRDDPCAIVIPCKTN